MAIFNAISRERFLKDYWQQQVYIFRQSMMAYIDCVNGNDLAGLACEEEVESRIISGSEPAGEWSCCQGPFNQGTFAKLPESNWTLLVQGVDQWFEHVAEILEQFAFLPRWRLEDIMASYAPIGGGVGPHFDYYDVFLIQISGSRQWKLGQECDSSTALQNRSDISLLQQFETAETCELHAGDMLYIPAGKSHWGIANSDDCITFSIGFRAPSEKELLSATLGNLINSFTEHHRYRDSLLSIDDNPAKINTYAHQQLGEFLATLSADKWQQAINQSFGELVTEPRYPPIDEEQDGLSLQDIELSLQEQGELVFDIPPCTRIAFSETQLFVNGDSYHADEYFSQQVEQGRVSNDKRNQPYLSILLELINNAAIILRA